MRELSRPKILYLPQSHSTSHLFLHDTCSLKYALYQRSMVLTPVHTFPPGMSITAA
jgi:hypothetical protein